MGKVFLGFIIGVIATSLSFVVLYDPSRSEQSDIPAEPDAPATGGDIPPSRDDDRMRIPESGEPSSTQAPAAAAAESREGRLTRELDEARRFISDATRELEELRRTRILAEKPILYPLPLAPDLSWVSADPDRAYLHELVQRETRDDRWAGQMESELQTFFYEQPDVIQELGIPTINCRSTRCEVTFVNRSASERSLEVGGELRSVFSRRWRDRVSSEAGSFWFEERYEEGVATLFWNFRRRE